LCARSLQDGRDSGARKLTLGILQREIGSSAPAVAHTLRKLADQPAWKAYKEKLQAGGRSGGHHRLGQSRRAAQNSAQRRAGSGAIFTHFQATLDALAERLTAAGIDFIPYYGGLTIEQKDEAIRRFEEEGRVLLSTEAAGEGRNLQFCHVMVNFDLPWNPQRIEQRVGRIHRVGQENR
jgi:superfamily II DNA/RNA helicase